MLRNLLLSIFADKLVISKVEHGFYTGQISGILNYSGLDKVWIDMYVSNDGEKQYCEYEICVNVFTMWKVAVIKNKIEKLNNDYDVKYWISDLK